ADSGRDVVPTPMAHRPKGAFGCSPLTVQSKGHPKAPVLVVCMVGPAPPPRLLTAPALAHARQPLTLAARIAQLPLGLEKFEKVIAVNTKPANGLRSTVSASIRSGKPSRARSTLPRPANEPPTQSLPRNDVVI